MDETLFCKSDGIPCIKFKFLVSMNKKDGNLALGNITALNMTLGKV